MSTNLSSIPVIVSDLHNFLHLHTIHHSLQVLSFLQHHHIFLLTLSFLSATCRHGIIFSLFFFLITLSWAPFSLAINTSLLSPLSLNVKLSEIVAYLCFLKFFPSLSKICSSWVFYNHMSSETILIQVTNNFHLVIL